MAAVAADAAIAALKFIGGALTGSAAMIAEGIHSVVDGSNASLVLLGERRGKRPPNPMHPLGHGMEVYFWTVVVAMVTFVLGGGLAVLEGVLALSHGGTRRVWIAFTILGAAFVFELVSLVIGRRELVRYRGETGYRGSLWSVMRQSHNPPIFYAVIEDTAALVGLLIAALGLGLSTLLHMPLFDALASILDGVLLMGVAALLCWETRSLIVGERAGDPVVADAQRTIARQHGLGEIARVDTLQLGPDQVLVLVQTRPDGEQRAGDLSRAAQELERRLREQHPSIQHVLFDFD